MKPAPHFFRTRIRFGEHPCGAFAEAMAVPLSFGPGAAAVISGVRPPSRVSFARFDPE